MAPPRASALTLPPGLLFHQANSRDSNAHTRSAAVPGTTWQAQVGAGFPSRERMLDVTPTRPTCGCPWRLALTVRWQSYRTWAATETLARGRGTVT